MMFNERIVCITTLHTRRMSHFYDHIASSIQQHPILRFKLMSLFPYTI